MKMPEYPLTTRNYQQSGIEFMLTPRVPSTLPTYCRSLNMDAPGSGKSHQSCEAAYQLTLENNDSICVITPAHLTPQWFKHLSMQYPNDSIVWIEGSKAQREKDSKIKAKWYIISTQSLRQEHYYDLMLTLFNQHHITCTIIDESHYVKNRDALQSKHIQKLTHPSNCPHVILLSATPIMREADDLYHQLKIIDPFLFSSHNTFLNVYCWFDWTAWGATNVILRKGAIELLQEGGHSPYANAPEQPPYLLGRSYEQIGLELPRMPALDPILIPLSPKRRKTYDDLKFSWLSMLDEGESLTANNAMELMHLLRRITNAPEKRAALTEYIADDPGPYFIVCDYKWSVSDLAADLRLSNKDLRVTEITGEIPAEERIELAKRNSTNSNDVIVATLGSVPEGADLSSCNTVYFYEEARTPGKMYQVLSRVRRHRESNTTHGGVQITSSDDGGFDTLSVDIDPNERPIICRYFHAHHTIDEHIHAVQTQRAFNIKDLIKVELGL